MNCLFLDYILLIKYLSCHMTITVPKTDSQTREEKPPKGNTCHVNELSLSQQKKKSGQRKNIKVICSLVINGFLIYQVLRDTE